MAYGCGCTISYRCSAHASTTEELYYVQDTRSYCGNSVMWWRVEGEGYTSNLEEAWKVPASWRGRDTDKLWLCSAIDKGATRQFDMQKLRDIPYSWADAR